MRRGDRDPRPPRPRPRPALLDDVDAEGAAGDDGVVVVAAAVDAAEPTRIFLAGLRGLNLPA